MKKNSKQKVTVIDLFAGPGGLGEGFSNCLPNSPFKIAFSVEYEENAHKTLTLRSFYRKLTKQERSKYYYPFIMSTDEETRELKRDLMISACSAKWKEAEEETLKTPHTLGKPVKWEKIRNNEPLSDQDNEATADEQNIEKRILEVKSKLDGPLILIGGPPCQAYSINGRNRIKAEKNYKPENDERFFLYQEYLKVLDKANPDAFVMENVEGILSAKLATGELIFERIKKEIIRPKRNRDEQYDIYSLVCEPDQPANEEHGPKYKDDGKYVITASKFGVPQARKRVILFGIKHKYGPVTDFMTPDGMYAPKAAELLDGLPRLRSGISQRSEAMDDTSPNWEAVWEENKEELIQILEDRNEIDKIVSRHRKKLSTNKKFSSEHIDIETKKRQAEIEDAFSKTIKELKKVRLKSDFSNVNSGRGSSLYCEAESKTSPFSTEFKRNYPELHAWLDKGLSGAANHDTREHMISDLQRYMFSAAWTKAHAGLKSPFPKSKDYPFSLSPDHKNWESGHQADRFRTIGAGMVPLTITSHLRKDGHAQIHYDLTQNRSLTVREAARIQTFPDDYYFEGARGWQYQQVGNAVPAFLAKQIANHVLKIMTDKGLV